MRIFICQSLLYCYLFAGFSSPAKPVVPVRHPLHVSTTTIELNAKTHHFEVICSIFTDDFESLLTKKNAPARVDLAEPSKHTAMDPLVKKYVLDHVSIQANGKPAVFTYIGFEKEKEFINVYLESGDVPVLKKIDAEISLLYDMYEDQSNIVHITVNGKRNSTKIDNPERKVSVVF